MFLLCILGMNTIIGLLKFFVVVGDHYLFLWTSKESIKSSSTFKYTFSELRCSVFCLHMLHSKKNICLCEVFCLLQVTQNVTFCPYMWKQFAVTRGRFGSGLKIQRLHQPLDDFFKKETTIQCTSLLSLILVWYQLS